MGAGMVHSSMVQERLHGELAKITDASVRDAIAPWLVNPRSELRDWDYGTDGQTFQCWIVLDHPPSNTCIAYCDDGFGPAAPWGLLCIAGAFLSMGMDSGWFKYFEDAFRASKAWDGVNPVGYEVR